MNAKLFGRIGTWEDVRLKIIEAESVGCLVIRNTSAGTVKATFDGEVVFAALDKGNGGWLVCYSRDYYPET